MGSLKRVSKPVPLAKSAVPAGRHAGAGIAAPADGEDNARATRDEDNARAILDADNARAILDVDNARAILDALPHAIIVLDSDERIVNANAAAEPFFGLSIASLQHLNLRELVPSDNPLFMLIGQVRTHGGTIAEHDVALESPRLSKHDITAQGTLLSEHPSLVLLTFQEGASLRALDRRMNFRNAARSVSGMAAILAHEIKNPLSGIRGAAQLLEGTVAPNDRELAVLIRDEADRIRALVERMEMFSEKPIERRPVNIHRVLEHVRRLAHSGFAAHIKIVERYDPSLPPVWGNRDQLVQVLLNLIKNAAESISSAPGHDGARPCGGEITLGTAYHHGLRITAPGTVKRVHLPLLVTVRDNGPGIPEDIKPHLFEPFVTSKPTGSGLGLALAAKIIGDHGGMIEIDTIGGRTEVRLLLPVLTENQDGNEVPDITMAS